MNYCQYHFSKKQYFAYTCQFLLLLALVSYLFYHSYLPFLIFFPFLRLYLNMKRKELIKNRLNKLLLEFKDAILAIAAALQAGYSIENAFAECLKEMKMQYGENSCIVYEFTIIDHRLQMNDTLERILQDFAERCNLEDVREFTEVFRVAKKSGGDYISIIQATVDTISSKIEIKNDIAALLSGKKYEQKTLSIIPLAIIAFVGFSSPGFLDALYKNIIGVTIMTVCLILYITAIMISNKIMSIEV